MALLCLLIPLAVPAGLFAPNLVAVATSDVDSPPAPARNVAPGPPGVELDHERPTRRRDLPRRWLPPRTHTATLARLLRLPSVPSGPRVLAVPRPPAGPAAAGPVAQPRPEPGALADRERSEPKPVEDSPEAVNPFPDPEDPEDIRWPEPFVVELPGAGSYRLPPTVPEPDTRLLLGAGLVGLAVLRRSVRRAEAQSRALRIG